MIEDQTAQTQTTQAVAGPRVLANRYTLTAELGRGGMGVVWRGEDTVIGRPVAIKELRLPDGAKDAGVFAERVLREVRTGGRLNDPAVVTVYDVLTDAGTTYIVMELVEAPTLSEMVRRHGPLPPHQVASIGEQVLSALRAAHDAGIVHRDVKPANIMVAPNGRVKLTDFGIAQAVDDPRLTTSGMIVGSPAFMAPERVAGREALPASDLWSLGATLFFAVEGNVPFERSTTAATLHAIMNEVPYLTHVQGPLASAIMGLMISAPEARISSDQARGLLSLAAQQPGAPTSPHGHPTVAQGQPPTMLAHASQGAVAGPPGSTAKRKALVTGGVLAAVGLLVGGFFLGKPVWSPATDEALHSTLTYGTGGDVEELYVDGSDHCVNTPIVRGRTVSDSNWVDCEQPHDAELYEAHRAFGDASYDDDVMARYPGTEWLTKLAESACGTVFHSNRIKDMLRPGLRYQVLIPSQQEWEKRPESTSDDPARHVYCFAVDAGGGQLTGTTTQEVK